VTDPHFEFVRQGNLEAFARQIAGATPGPRRDTLVVLLAEERAKARPAPPPR
jgi:hypothetical protein